MVHLRPDAAAPPSCLIALPISGRDAVWQAATGAGDLVLLAHPPGLRAALELTVRCATAADGDELDAPALPVGDLERLVVARRIDLLGDGFVAEGSCATCGSPVDVHFGLAAYLDHHRPRGSRAAVRTGPAQWRLRSSGTSFRAPTAADVVAAASASDLAAWCIGAGATAREVRAVDRVLATVAPTLRADVIGTCPECGAGVLLDVDVCTLVLGELRFLAGGVLDDVHLIASSYHWSETDILALPSARRTAYAQLVRSGRVAPDLVEVGDG